MHQQILFMLSHLKTQIQILFYFKFVIHFSMKISVLGYVYSYFLFLNDVSHTDVFYNATYVQYIF